MNQLTTREARLARPAAMLEHPLPVDPLEPVRDNTIDGTHGPTPGSGYI